MILYDSSYRSGNFNIYLIIVKQFINSIFIIHFNKLEGEEYLFPHYDEFEDISVLNVLATETCFFIHLKNGHVLSWSEHIDNLGRKCNQTAEECHIPMPLTINNKLKILDLSCGSKHCIIKTSDHQIFTWGNNLFGQVFD